MIVFFKKKENQIIIALLILLVMVLRSLIPDVKYIIPIVGVSSLLFFIREFKWSLVFLFFKKNWIITLLILSYLFAFFNTDIVLWSYLSREILNLLIILYALFTLYLIYNQQDIFVHDKFIKYIIYLIVVLSILGVIKYLLSLIGFQFYSLFYHGKYPVGTSISEDNNFTALAFLIGLYLIIEFRLRDKKLKFDKLFTFFIIVSVLFSSSRRAVFVLLVFILIYPLALFFFRKIQKNYLRRIFPIYKVVLIGIFSINFILFILLFGTSDQLKKQVFLKYADNENTLKYRSTVLFGRYVDIFDKQANSKNIYNKLWKQDEKVGQSILSNNSVSLALKRLNDYIFLNKGVYKKKENNVLNDEINEFSVWGKAIVKDIKDYNGKVCLLVYTKDLGGVVKLMSIDSSDIVSYSTFIKIIKWDKNLRLQSRIDSNKYKIKAIDSSFSNLEKWKHIEQTVTYNKAFNSGIWIGGAKNETLFLLSGFHIFKNKERVNRHLYNRKLYKVLPNLEEIYGKIDINQIRKKYTLLAREFDDKRAKRNALKAQIKCQQRKNFEFMDTRILRWKYAFTIFKKYSLSQKLFGDGFNYLSLFGHKYLKGNQCKDYPHNPLISAFLYSGIIGGLIYLFFLLSVLYKYWVNRDKLRKCFSIFLLVLFFSFFSGNSHFSIPILIIFSFIPFIFGKQMNNNQTI